MEISQNLWFYKCLKSFFFIFSRYQLFKTLNIRDSSSVDLAILRVFAFAICKTSLEKTSSKPVKANLELVLTNFQSFSTFRPKSACSCVRKIDLTQKYSDRSIQNFTDGGKLMSEKVCKKSGAAHRCFWVIQDLRQRAIPSPPPSITG